MIINYNRIYKINLNIIKLFLLGCVLSFVYCVNPGDINERVNPFDTNGDYWYPPTVDIIGDTIIGTIYDSLSITVKTSDQNDITKYFKWIRTPDSTQTIDTVLNFDDTIVIYDSIPVIETTIVDTIEYLDSIIYKEDADSAYETGIDTVFIIIKDDNTFDTVSYVPGADTTYDFDKEGSLYDVFKIFMAESLVVETTIVNSPVIDSIYYKYIAKFSISTPDTFRFFVTAIDLYGVESETADSVVVMVADTGLSDIY